MTQRRNNPKNYAWTDDGKEPVYRIVEGRDHFTDKPLYRVVGTNNDYAGLWTYYKQAKAEKADLEEKAYKGAKANPEKPEGRVVKTIGPIKVYHNAEWDEYVVAPAGTDSSKWRTRSTKKDAIDMAYSMLPDPPDPAWKEWLPSDLRKYNTGRKRNTGKPLTLGEIKDALHAQLDTYRDSEIRGGVTVAVTDTDGTVYSVTTDGMSVRAAVAAIDNAQRKWDLFDPDVQRGRKRNTSRKRNASPFTRKTNPKGSIGKIFWLQNMLHEDEAGDDGVAFRPISANQVEVWYTFGNPEYGMQAQVISTQEARALWKKLTGQREHIDTMQQKDPVWVLRDPLPSWKPKREVLWSYRNPPHAARRHR